MHTCRSHTKMHSMQQPLTHSKTPLTQKVTPNTSREEYQKMAGDVVCCPPPIRDTPLPTVHGLRKPVLVGQAQLRPEQKYQKISLTVLNTNRYNYHQESGHHNIVLHSIVVLGALSPAPWRYLPIAPD